MASSCSYWLNQNFIFSFLFVIITITNSQVNGCFSSVFSFGDSLTDTGNLLEIALSTSTKLPPSAFPPNGQTFFHHPAGRRCDGRLAIDFLSEALGFPFLLPYFGVKKGPPESFRTGVNFAVAGATALDSAFLAERGIPSRTTNISLLDEVGFFKDFFPYLCSYYSDCKGLLRSSLIVMGEIGGNDYNHALREGIDIEEVRQFVPLVVQIIASAIKELIDLGAVTFLVPGNTPFGCSPSLLTYFQSSDEEEYDPVTGCLTWANQLAEYHNEMLQKRLEKIRNLHPNVNIVYGDYYNAAMRIYRSPKQFGFRETLKACCGMGGAYNYNSSMSCGYPPLTSSCNNPSSYVSWDGVHYTEAAYKFLSGSILQRFYTVSNGSIQLTMI
ncbi:hypothetical protein PTKIN_Ptkin14bG0046000 [Pterospermum kingtungense]